MRYLYGDSSESDLEFDYLAFIREVIDCAVVMAECEVTLAVTVEGRRTREQETAAVIAAVDDLGKRVGLLVGPVAKDQASTPVGRCAAAIGAAIRDAVDKESSQARAALAVERDEMDKQDGRQRARAKDVLEKLLRTHDLPGATKELEVIWTAGGVKATMRQKTGFNVEAVLSLDIPPGSLLGLDLRVDRVAEGVEVHAHETGGWLKKSDKLVAHRLGRYHVTGVTVGAEATTVRLRGAPDANAAGYTITSRRNGDLVVEPTGGGPTSEVEVDDRDRPKLRQLVEKLETAVQALSARSGLVSVEIDGKSLAQHGHPRVLAERLIAAIAPTVQKIAKHSRSPGELVLRRLIGDNRREEIYVSTGELLKRLDGLPSHAREVFAPLQLGGESARPGEVRPVGPPIVSAPAADRKFDAEPETRPDAKRPASRTAPPPVPMPEPRSGPNKLSPPIGGDLKRVTKPTPPRGETPQVDSPMFEDKESPFGARSETTVPNATPVAIPPKTQPASEAKAAIAATRTAGLGEKPVEIASESSRKRADDSAIGKAIDKALDEEEGTPPPK